MVWRFRLDDGTIHEEPDNVSYDVALARARRANNPESVNESWLGDMGDALESGAWGTLESLGGLVDLLPAYMGTAAVGGDTVGGAISDFARENRRRGRRSFSPEALETQEREGILGIRGATAENIPFLAAESAPGTALSFLGGGAARVAGAAPNAAKWVGAGIEGILGAGGVGTGVEEAIRDFAATNPEEFIQSEVGREALERVHGNYAMAVEVAAQRAKGIMPLVAGAVTGAVGGGIGSNIFEGPARQGFIRAILSGATREGIEEFIQSGNEQFATNVDVRNVDESRPLEEGVLDSAVLGGILGASMGGGLGTIRETASRFRPPPPATPPPTPSAPGAPTAPPAPTAPAQPSAAPGAPTLPPEDIEPDKDGEDDPIVAIGVDELANNLGYAQPEPPTSEGVRERRVEEAPLYGGMDRTDEASDPLVQGVYAGALARGENIEDTATFQAFTRLENGLYGALPPEEGQQPAAMGYRIVDIMEDGSERISYSQSKPADDIAEDIKPVEVQPEQVIPKVSTTPATDQSPGADPLVAQTQGDVRLARELVQRMEKRGAFTVEEAMDEAEGLTEDSWSPEREAAFYNAVSDAYGEVVLMPEDRAMFDGDVKEGDIIPPKKPESRAREPETIDGEAREITETGVAPGTSVVPVGKPTTPKQPLATRKQLPSTINNHLRALYQNRGDALKTTQYIDNMAPMQAKAALKALGGKNVVGDTAVTTRAKLRRALPRALAQPVENSVFADIQEMIGAVPQQKKTKAPAKAKPKKAESDSSGEKEPEAKPQAEPVKKGRSKREEEIQKEREKLWADEDEARALGEQIAARKRAEREAITERSQPDNITERSLPELKDELKRLQTLEDDAYENAVKASVFTPEEIASVEGAIQAGDKEAWSVRDVLSDVKPRKGRRSQQTPEAAPAKEKARAAPRERTAADIKKDREARDTSLAQSLVLNQPSMETALYEAERYVQAERDRSNAGLRQWTTQREIDLMNKIKALYGQRPMDARKTKNERFYDPRLKKENKAVEMILNGFTISEVADEMDVSNDTVSVYLSRARKLGIEIPKQPNRLDQTIGDEIIRLSQRQPDGSLLTAKQISERLNLMGYTTVTPESVDAQKARFRRRGINLDKIRNTSFKPPKATRGNAPYDRKWSADMQEAIKAAVACAAAQVATPWTGMAIGAAAPTGGYLAGAAGSLMGLAAAPLAARGIQELIRQDLATVPSPGVPFSEAVDEQGYINEFAMPDIIEGYGEMPEGVIQSSPGVIQNTGDGRFKYEPASAPEQREAASEEEAAANREVDRLMRDYLQAGRE